MRTPVQLGTVAEVIRDVSFGASDPRPGPAVGFLPILRAGNIGDALDVVHNLIWINRALVSRGQRMQLGDVAVCMSSGSARVVGKSAILAESFDGAVGAFCAIVRPHAALEPDYLGYYLRSPAFWTWRDNSARGVGIQNLKVSDLQMLPIPLPPLDEQRRIAAHLRGHLAEVESVREGVDERMRGLNVLVASAIRSAIGTCSGSAHPIELGSIAEVQLGKMMSPAARRGERALPYLRNANVQWDRFDLSDVGQMDFTVAEEAKFALRPDDVLVCEGGEPGRAAVWSGQIARCGYQKAVHRIRPLPARLDPQFLVYRLWLGALDGEFTNSHAATTIAHLPAVRLKDLKLALPPVDEQRRIASAAQGAARRDRPDEGCAWRAASCCRRPPSGASARGVRRKPMTGSELLTTAGAGLQVVGAVVALIGLIRTHDEFAPMRLSVMIGRRIRRAIARAQAGARQLLGRQPPAIVGSIGSIQGHASMTGRGRVGFGPLPGSTAEDIAALEVRTTWLMALHGDVQGRISDETAAIRRDLEALESRLTLADEHAKTLARRAAIGGIRLEAVGLFLVIVGLALQGIATIVS